MSISLPVCFADLHLFSASLIVILIFSLLFIPKTECDYLYGWLKNGHIRRNLTQNGEPQRQLGNAEEEEVFCCCCFCLGFCFHHNTCVYLCVAGFFILNNWHSAFLPCHIRFERWLKMIFERSLLRCHCLSHDLTCMTCLLPHMKLM